MDDALGTFKGKRVTDVYEGGGAAGRALAEDFKGEVQGHLSQREKAARVVKTAQAIETVAKLRRCLAATKDAVKCQEIQVLINGLTKQFDLADGQKAQRPGTGLLTADEGKAVQLLVTRRSQARDIAVALEAMIDTTIDNPTREALGLLAGKIRLEYQIPAEERGPGSLVFTPGQADQISLTDQRREQGRAMAASLDDLADKTDDPNLREVLRSTANRAWATFGRPTESR